MPPGEPLLIINPAGDRAFVLACHDAMDPPLPQPDELEARLRQGYPYAVVRPRSLAGERLDVWYVYRDGHWVSSP
jgi:hypothetical protein